MAIGAGALGTALLMVGSRDNVLILGGKVTGLFERANQVQSFMVVVIPFLCVSAMDATESRSIRLVHGALIFVALLSVLASGSRAGIVLVALSLWLTLLLASLRACAVFTCAAVLAAGSAWAVFEEYRADMPFAVQRALSFVDQDSYELNDLSVPRSNGLAVWQTVFVEHPLIGIGPDQFRNYVPLIVPGAKAQEAHDSYLAVLAETGVVGASFVVMLLGTVLWRGVRFLQGARFWSRRATGVARALLVAYVCLLLFGLLHNGLRQRYFWFVIALTVSLPRIYALDAGVRERAGAKALRREPSLTYAPGVSLSVR